MPSKQIKQGKPVSGRTWKLEAKKASIGKVVPPSLKISWEKKLEERKKLGAMKAKERGMKEEIKREKEEKKKQRELRKKLREENELKSNVYQKITNLQKMKKMNKKQLKMIRKL